MRRTKSAAAKIRKIRVGRNFQFVFTIITRIRLQEHKLFRRIPSLLLSLPLQHPALLTVTGEGNSHGDLLDMG